jgi:uncharacterized protein YgiM (DUF1202 family)
VVGVLLFAVIWQLAGLVQSDHRTGTDATRDTEAPVVDQSVSAQFVAQTFLTTDDVNLRRGPGTDHEVISVVPIHAEVVVTGESLNGFVPVQVGGTSAWLAESYLARGGVPDGSTDEEAPAPEAAVEADAPVEQAVMAADIDVEPVEPRDAAPAPEPETESHGVPLVSAGEIRTEEPVTLAANSSSMTTEDMEAEEPGERWVDVNRTTRTVTLYEGDRVVDRFPALIGKDLSPDGYYSTAVGTFFVHSMTPDLVETPFADNVYLTHFVGFDAARSNGFHSPTRDADGNVVQTGGTATLGCVRLSEPDAIRMFEFSYIGMRVEVHD